MIPRFNPPALLLALLAVAARPVQAASFNCAKATKPDEKAICDSTKLSDLDVEMATLYRVRMELPMLMGARGAAQDEQRAFLAQRGNCGAGVACLQAAYAARIAVLNQTIKAAMQDYCTKLGICG
jgi:uncharacterized protein